MRGGQTHGRGLLASGSEAAEAVITFRLCRAFGWTPRQVRRQSARDIERLLLILNEWHALREGYGPTSTGLPSTALGTGSAGVGPGATTILVTED